jgi:hypothetical protein
MFFLAVWFQRERGETLLPVAIMRHILRSMVKSEAENDMKVEFLSTSIEGSSLCDDEELAWCFLTCSNDIGKWGRHHM